MQEEKVHCLVDLDVPLLGLLQALDPFIVINILLLGNSLQHILDSGHHSLQTAEVDVRTILQLLKDLIGVLLDLVLDVHLATGLVSLFTRKGVVKAEVIRELLLGLLELVIVKKGVAVGDTEEKPGFTLVSLGSRGIFEKETT